MKDDTLVIIPARGGSKGIPGKNIKLLGGKPLIYYTIELARKLFQDEHICVSTDSLEIKNVVERTGLKVPFIRPAEIATDSASTQEVVLHAFDYYTKLRDKSFNNIILFQPTSPFRKHQHLEEALAIYNSNLDMVVSVKKTKANPYFTLYESDDEGLINRVAKGNFTSRQECPPIYELNGSIYIYNPQSIQSKKISEFDKIAPYEMPDIYSVDIDTPLDWEIAEMLVRHI